MLQFADTGALMHPVVLANREDQSVGPVAASAGLAFFVRGWTKNGEVLEWTKARRLVRRG
jgi:hypothetical protein